MLPALWSGVGGKLAERWLDALFSPAFGFWAAGLVAWGWSRRAPGSGLGGAVAALVAAGEAMPTGTQAILVVVALIVVTASGVAAGQVTLPVLRLLEGYWPGPADGLRRQLTARRGRHLDRDAARWRSLRRRDPAQRSAREEAELVRLTARRHRTPPVPHLRMPTALGDVLRAAELRPHLRYGLGAATCWPRLWLLLPDGTRTEVAAARRRLDLAAQLWLWGVLLVAWAAWAWWMAIAASAVALAAYVAAVRSAEVFGDLVLATYDVHRGLLYDAMQWEQPEAADEEIRQGRRLTAFLRRGPALAATPAPPDDTP